MPYWRLYYHIVWPTEGRLPIITDSKQKQVYDAIRRKVHALGGHLHGIGGIADHVHIAVSIPPTMSLSKFVGELIGSTSYHINHLPGNSQRLEWQRGFGVISFRVSDLEQVLSYIENQEEHHSKGTIFKSLEHYEDDDKSMSFTVNEDIADYWT